MPGKKPDNGFSPSSSPTNKTVLMKKSGSILVNKRSSSSKTPKERTISVFEHNLTYHVRQTLQRLDSSSTTQKSINSSLEQLRKQKKEHLDKLSLFGYILSLFCCISAGSVMIISLYSSTWLTLLNYNSLQINLISSCINMGAYMIPPFLGFICDTHGPVTLSLISLFAFVPHYLYMSKTASLPAEEVKHFGLILYSCFMIGCGTSSLYFASLISCSKFFTDSKVLSISMPTTLYGSSSVLFAYVLTHWKKLKFPIDDEKNPQGEFFDLQVVFKFMAIFYFMVIILNYLASTIVTHLKLEYELLDQRTSEEIESEQPLLEASNTNYSAITDEEESEEVLTTDTEDTVLVAVAEDISNNKYDANLRSSLKDKLCLFLTNRKTLLLFSIVFLSIGPLETYVSNMASISKLYSSEEITYSPQVVLSNFSICSTVIRFFVGIIIDVLTKIFGKQYKNIDLYLMMFFLSLGLVTQMFLYKTDSNLRLLSSFMGLCYGGLFTIFPIITLNHYDKDIFAIAYGCFLLAPAIGTPCFSLVFAKIFDANQCLVSWFSYDCIKTIFMVTSISFGLCINLSVIIKIMSNNQTDKPLIV
ncbi:uncharacterized protein HGUI_03153 [Hanseniaspora guilliermondii]|uniref:Probable transporter MCH1 n=1 Tax=Hanseniaspora guilliermondii TaxID=56406 RepID=A0A1L0CR03_9ASCO|nr:uncharacterized protein HGUI_03153 [Hanseniaspora guilliermondii]